VYAALNTIDASYGRRQAFATCGSSWWVLESRTRPATFKLARDFCHDRWCVACAAQRATVVAGNLLQAIGDRPTRLVTLTVRSTNTPLKAQITHLLTSFRRLRRRPLWSTHVDGGCGLLEITYNDQTSQYHPHLHCVTVGRFLPQDSLANDWEACTGDSRIVDIRFVNNRDAAAKYVTKYLTKPITMAAYRDPPILAESIAALRGVKQLITFGTWRTKKLLHPLTDDAWTSLGHWHELLANGYDRHAELVDAILRNPARAVIGEFTLADLDHGLPQERPP